MGPNDLDLMQGLPPEVLEQLLGMGTLDERGGLVDAQLAQLQRQSQPSGTQFSTGTGAALGGMANALRSLHGGIKGQALQGQQQDLLGQKDAGRKAYVDAILKHLRGQGQGGSGAEGLDVLPPQMF